MNFINNKLRDEIGELNTSKGWHDEHVSISQHCILLHSEVSEIVEDYRNNKKIDEVWYEYKISKDDILRSDKKRLEISYSTPELGKPCGIPSELADVVIRALDMAYEYNVDLEYIKLDYGFGDYKGIEDAIGNMHACISYLFVGIDEIKKTLENLICWCYEISEINDINIEQQIRDKIEYNKTRPVRHGNKRL